MFVVDLGSMGSLFVWVFVGLIVLGVVFLFWFLKKFGVFDEVMSFIVNILVMVFVILIGVLFFLLIFCELGGDEVV